MAIEQTAPKDTVGEFFQKLGGGDVEGAFAKLSPEVVWTYHGPKDKIPFAGTFIGVAGVQNFFSTFGEAAEPIEMTPEGMWNEGETVFVRGIEASRVKATGKEYRVGWVHVVSVKDGKITSLDEYIDSAAVADAFIA